MMSIDDVVVIGEIRAARRSHVDRAGDAAVVERIMDGIVYIIITLHDRIVDACIIYGQPGSVIRIDGCQFSLPGDRGESVAQVFHDYRFILQQIRAAGDGLVLRIERVVEHVAGIKDEESCKQAGYQGEHTASRRGDLSDKGFECGFQWCLGHVCGLLDRILGSAGFCHGSFLLSSDYK